MLSRGATESSSCAPGIVNHAIAVGKKGEKRTDRALRERIRAWLWHLRQENADVLPRLDDFAAKLDFPSVGEVLNGDKDPGLDLLVRMHRNLGADLNKVVDYDPVAKTQAPPIPPDASPATVRRRRHGQTGGR